MGFLVFRGRKFHKNTGNQEMVPKEGKSGSNPEEESARSSQIQVVLNVYDLTPLNHYTYWFGFGVFHSGIEVYGMEYGFGAHDFPVSGVFEVEPKSCPGFVYRTSITLGTIRMSSTEFRSFIENVAAEYHGDTYNLISKNCNHFTDDIARRLTGKHIPGWVNRLAHAGALCSCLLPESLQVTTIKQSADYHECGESTDDGTDSSSADSSRLALIGTDEIDQFKHHLLPSNSVNNEVAFLKDTGSVERTVTLDRNAWITLEAPLSRYS